MNIHQKLYSKQRYFLNICSQSTNIPVIPGPKSFDYLLTVDGYKYHTLYETTIKRGSAEPDDLIDKLPLIFLELSNTSLLWEKKILS